jgi:hypothetical protein
VNARRTPTNDPELVALVCQYRALRVFDRARAKAWALASLELVPEVQAAPIVRRRRNVTKSLGGRVVRGNFGRAATTAEGRAQ